MALAAGAVQLSEVRVDPTGWHRPFFDGSGTLDKNRLYNRTIRPYTFRRLRDVLHTALAQWMLRPLAGITADYVEFDFHELPIGTHVILACADSHRGNQLSFVEHMVTAENIERALVGLHPLKSDSNPFLDGWNEFSNIDFSRPMRVSTLHHRACLNLALHRSRQCSLRPCYL